MKKILILLKLFLLNACQVEQNIVPQSANENRLPEITRLTAVPTAPIRQISADQEWLYLLDAEGKLWETGGRRTEAHLLQGGLSPNSLINADSTGTQKNKKHFTANHEVSAIYQSDTHQYAKWATWRDSAHTAYGGRNPAPYSQTVWDSGCLIALEQDEKRVFPVRICPIKEGMDLAAKAGHLSILPDNRPILFENKVLFLGEPDDKTYPHGVLGDTIEAKTLYTLDAQTLKPAAKPFRLPENLVFENNTVTLWGDKVVAVISGGGAGARVAVLALADGHWQIVAESAPLPTNRWQSPFVFQNQLYAVQMPHLRGRLVRYAMQGKHLIEQELGDGFSNHEIGSRETQIAAILPDYALIPQMDLRHVVALDGSGSLKRLAPELPAKIVRSAVQNRTAYFLLADGSVWAWSQPER